MDAVVYIKEKVRMCHNDPAEKVKCDKCPMFADTVEIGCVYWEETDPTEAVRIVEKWSKAHPIQTNADKFKEVFGVTPFNDLLEDYVCPPSTARGETGCSLKRCDECSHSYWDMPYEAPKGAE